MTRDKARSQNSTRGSRKDLIALATIEVLGKDGSRGLSHRNIDKYLGLAEGSTSFYFRRRDDLLGAGFSKLIENDLKNMTKYFAPVTACLVADDPVDVHLIATCHYNFWKWVTRPKNRNAALARFEFFLQGARRPELLNLQNELLQGLFDFGASIFSIAGAVRPNWVAFQYFNIIRADAVAHFLIPASLRGLDVTADYFFTRISHILEASKNISQDLPPSGF